MSGFHVVAGADDTFERPAIRRLTLSDLKAALRLGVDDFFEKVMVNADDPALRLNRLRLLDKLRQATLVVADLTRVGV